MTRTISAEALGFTPTPSNDEDASVRNFALMRNEASPFCRPKEPFIIAGSGLSVDPYYGQVYENGQKLPKGVYGITDELPTYAGERLCNHGFLRVPFRRIPRILMKNRTEFDQFIRSIHSADPNLIVLYRGQGMEHYIPRSPEAKSILFGDDEALEPSLLPSASRSGTSLEEIDTEWSAVFQIFIWLWTERLKSTGDVDLATIGRISSQMEMTVAGYNLWSMLLSLAQHYGLPSAGLDLTDKPEVALYFALTKLTPDPNHKGMMKCERVGESSKYPVIYLLSCEKESVLSFERYRPIGFPIGRPDKQNAFFFHTAWGLASNVAATRIFVALYLDPVGNWGKIPETETLFPYGDRDPFANFLARVQHWKTSDRFSEFMKNFYWAV